MDKKSILAMVLIAIVIILLPYYQQLIVGEKPRDTEKPSEIVSDQKMPSQPSQDETEKHPIISDPQHDVFGSPHQSSTTAREYAVPIFQDTEERTLTIQTNKIKAVLSNRGGGSLKEYSLLKYSRFDGPYVNLIDPEINNGLNLSFQNQNGQFINTNDFLFNSNITLPKVYLDRDNSHEIIYELQIDNRYLRKKYVFYKDHYHFDLIISFSDPLNMLLNSRYEIAWLNGLPSTEKDHSDDYSYSQVLIYMAKDLDNYSVSDQGKKERVNLSGSADWLAVRMKYFVTAMINKNPDFSEGVFFSGEGVKKDGYVQRLYEFGFHNRYANQVGDTLRIYMGPMDHGELAAYKNNLNKMVMNSGWYERAFRFISLLILPVLEFLYSIIPNYGIVIIIFSILIKIIVYPLTKKSYSSMKEMQTIQPLMAEIREKYKDDPQRMNKEMMKLYKDHGVNPLGGCLPMLLQMPLLIALFIVFRSTIQLRGAMFIPGWIPDLSLPDTIFVLPFSLPLYGNEFNLLPILMAVTMIFQSKMTMQDPKQKAMVYLMPVFMLLIFNRFPSGLNLYYTMFNLLTIIQQKYITKVPDKTLVEKKPPAKSKNKK